MIVSDEDLDKLMQARLERAAESRKPIYRPRLKLHKLFGDKKLLTMKVENSHFRSIFPFHAI